MAEQTWVLIFILSAALPHIVEYIICHFSDLRHGLSKLGVW